MARGTWGGALDQNVFKCNIRFQIGNNHCQTGFKVRDVAVNDNTPEDVSAPVVLWANDHFKNLLLGSDLLVAVDILKLGTDEGFTHNFAAGTVGTMSSGSFSPEPSFLASNISLKTQLRKRYGQGRMFWPVRGEEWVTGDLLNGPGIAAHQGVLDALATAFTGSTTTHDLLLCNAHGPIAARAATTSAPERAAIAPSWYDVESLRLNTTVTSIKSRRIGIGN